MIEETWQLIREAIDGEHARQNALKINKHARWCHFEAMQRTAEVTAQLMEDSGLEQVELIDTPADGVTSFGGWINPRALAIQDATLEIVEPRVPNPLLARYRKQPCSLMVYSRPTSAEGVCAELVAVPKANDRAAYKGRDVRGKIVLIDGGGITYGESAFDSGAIGLVSDHMPTDEFIRPADQMKHVRRWHNYTIPPWKTKAKGFGFSITPEQGRRIRQLLKKHKRVVLRAIVRGRYYDGKLNVVTALLPGETTEQIALTGHLYEWGADDNASGCGLAIEIARTIRELVDTGKIARPRRSLRLIFGMEIRGMNVYQALHPSVRQLVAGIDMDMVGCEQLRSRVVCSVGGILPANPCYAVPLVLHLAERLRSEYPYFRYKRDAGPMVDDNGFSEPMFAAPCPVVYQIPAPHHHNSLDVPSNLSARMFSLMGTMLGTYTLFLARAQFSESLWLAELVYESARRDILAECQKYALGQQTLPIEDITERFVFLGEISRRQVRSITRLVPRISWSVRDDGFLYPPDKIDRTTGLAQDVAISKRLSELGQRLETFTHAQLEDIRSRLQLPPEPKKPKSPSITAARRMAFRKDFAGYLGWEFMNKRARQKLLAQLGMNSMEWCSSAWTQSALFWSDGKRSVYDVWRKLQTEGHHVSLDQLILLLQTLADHDMVKQVPVLTAAKLTRTLRSTGIKNGDVVFVHASLSRFGYFHGGAEAMINGLLDAVGPEGTLVMPTFTFSFVGRQPFERGSTRSATGHVTEVFRRRAGVVRSNHPTHSVAAFGPAARYLCRGHSYQRPVFSKQGTFGKLLNLDARIIMLASPLSNTFYHMGEIRAGIPWRDYQVSIYRKGRIEQVLARQIPFHSCRSAVYELMERRGQIRRAEFGLDQVLLMHACAAVEAAAEIFQTDPLLATLPDCQCAHCRTIRGYVADRPPQR